MLSTTRARLAFGLVCLLAAPGFAQPLAEHPDVASVLRLLDEWTKTQMEYSGLPGLAIGIVHDQEVLWAKAYGFADVGAKRPLATNSIFRIASQSKLFTAVAVLRLRDAHKLGLDDPVASHLPWFSMLGSTPGAPPIMIRHLLTHTAGLPADSDSPYWTELDFPTNDVLRATVARQQVAYPPETKWKYSTLGLTLAGLIVEQASGRPYKDYVEREILAPLGMASTSAGVPSDEQRPRLAVGYGRRLPGNSPRSVAPLVDAQAHDPATGFSSSVEDMMRFLSWQTRLGEGYRTEVLAAATLREMQRVHWLQEDWQSGAGLGFSVTHTQDRDLVGHSGAYPGYRTQAALSPKEKLGVAVFTNADDGNPNRYLRKAFDWVAPAVARALRRDSEPPAADPMWAKYVGTYRSRGNDTKVLIVDGQLWLITPLEEDPAVSKSVLVPVGKHTFRIQGSTGPHGELARFELDAAGNVTRLFTGANYSMRIP